MADQLLKEAQELFEGEIDFEGQKTTELLSTVLLAVSGIIAFIVGLLSQNVHYMLWTGLAGTAITFLVVVPPYPFYNRSPLKWLPGAELAASGIEIDGKKLS